MLTFLQGCASTISDKGPPEYVWMSKTAIPDRKGETLGSYYWWSEDLLGALKECNAKNAAERAYYLD